MIGYLLSWLVGSNKGKQTPKSRQIPQAPQSHPVGRVRHNYQTEEVEYLDEPTEDDPEIFGKHCEKGIILGTEIEYQGSGRGGKPGKERQMIIFGDLKGPLGMTSCVKLVDRRRPWDQEGEEIGGQFLWCNAAGGLYWIETGEDGGISARVKIDRARVVFYKGWPMARVQPAPQPAPPNTFNIVFAEHVYYDPMPASWRNTRGDHGWLEVIQQGMHLPRRKPARKQPVTAVDRRWRDGQLHEENTMSDLRPARPATAGRKTERRQAEQAQTVVDHHPASLDESLAQLASRRRQVHQDVTVDDRLGPVSQSRPTVVQPPPVKAPPPKPPARSNRPRETRTPPSSVPKQEVANRAPVRSKEADWEEAGLKAQQAVSHRRRAA